LGHFKHVYENDDDDDDDDYSYDVTDVITTSAAGTIVIRTMHSVGANSDRKIAAYICIWAAMPTCEFWYWLSL